MIEQQEAAQKDSRKAAELARSERTARPRKAYLKSIEGGNRLSRTDPKTGERVFLEDAERAAEATRARTRISQSCG
jgi:hypothetical protein